MLKRFYTIDETITYLSERSRHPISRRDLFHLISEKRLRLCFVYFGSIATCDDDNEFTASVTGFFDFKGYMIVPPTYLGSIERAITSPSEDWPVYIGSFDGTTIPLEQFDKSPIPEGKGYFFCDYYMRLTGKKYVGMEWHEALQKFRDTSPSDNKPTGPEISYHETLIPAADIDQLLSESTSPQKPCQPERTQPLENKYTTRLLTIQAKAIQRFWVNYDPKEADTAPDSQAIIQWLQEQGCSKREAESIDLTIRHDTRKSGGAKPKG